MRVWYSDAYTHQSKNLGAKKLGDRGQPVKSLGYPEESAGYKVYDPITHRITVVRKPIFREEAEAPHTTSFETQVDDSDDDNDNSPNAEGTTPPTTHVSAQTPADHDPGTAPVLNPPSLSILPQTLESGRPQ